MLATGLWFLKSAISCIALYHCIKYHLFIFKTFRDVLRTSLLLQNNRNGNNSVISCDTVTILALCTFSDGLLSMYQVSLNPLPYYQSYAPDKLFTAKIKKGSNTVNPSDRVMFFAFCNFPHITLSVCQVSLNYLQYF